MRSPVLPELTFASGEARYLAPCVSLTLYVGPYDPAGVIDFYERSIEALGDRLTHYQAESMRTRAPIQSRARSMVPTWMTRPRERKNYFIEFHGAPRGISDASITLSLMWEPPRTAERMARMRSNWRVCYRQGAKPSLPSSILRVTLPLEHELAKPQALLDWVAGARIAQGPDLLSGGAGYALNHDSAVSDVSIRSEMLRRLAANCSRHPGLDWFSTGTAGPTIRRWDPAADDIAAQVKRVDWLTLMPEATVTRLGGEASLRAALAGAPGVEVRGLGHGLLIRAGEAPSIGDLGRRDFVPAYRSAARAIRPVRMRDIAGPSGVEEDWVTDWLEAFDKEYE